MKICVENSLRIKYLVLWQTSDTVTLVRCNGTDSVPFNISLSDFRIKYEVLNT